MGCAALPRFPEDIGNTNPVPSVLGSWSPVNFKSEVARQTVQ